MGKDDCALYFHHVTRGDWSNLVVEMRINIQMVTGEQAMLQYIKNSILIGIVTETLTIPIPGAQSIILNKSHRNILAW